MEIERKWLVTGWPQAQLEIMYEQEMEQAYVTVFPTVRVRKEQVVGRRAQYVFCLKSKSEDGISREEIEFNVSEEDYGRILKLIGKPPIIKRRRTYRLNDGYKLEVNCVDAGTEEEVWYAEIEYGDVYSARAWTADSDGLCDYLSNETTGDGSYTMGAYWARTRLGE